MAENLKLEVTNYSKDYMILEEWPTQAVVVMMMMMVEKRRTQRRFLVTSQGRGGTIDHLQSQHI